MNHGGALVSYFDLADYLFCADIFHFTMQF